MSVTINPIFSNNIALISNAHFNVSTGNFSEYVIKHINTNFYQLTSLFKHFKKSEVEMINWINQSNNDFNDLKTYLSNMLSRGIDKNIWIFRVDAHKTLDKKYQGVYTHRLIFEEAVEYLTENSDIGKNIINHINAIQFANGDELLSLNNKIVKARKTIKDCDKLINDIVNSTGINRARYLSGQIASIPAEHRHNIATISEINIQKQKMEQSISTWNSKLTNTYRAIDNANEENTRIRALQIAYVAYNDYKNAEIRRMRAAQPPVAAPNAYAVRIVTPAANN